MVHGDSLPGTSLCALQSSPTYRVGLEWQMPICCDGHHVTNPICNSQLLKAALAGVPARRRRTRARVEEPVEKKDKPKLKIRPFQLVLGKHWV